MIAGITNGMRRYLISRALGIRVGLTFYQKRIDGTLHGANNNLADDYPHTRAIYIRELHINIYTPLRVYNAFI